MYSGGITFSIAKSFGSLQLIPEATGLRIYYVASSDSNHNLGSAHNSSSGLNPSSSGLNSGSDAVASPAAELDLLLPLEAVGGLWATARAFLYGVEALDENVILKDAGTKEDPDILIKLYRDKPKGQQGKLAGDELCWLRIVTGRTEEERRRIKLGPRDLLSLELACSVVSQLATQSGSHSPSR